MDQCIFFGPRSTRTIILSCIIVQNHGDLILGKNLDFYRHFLVLTKYIRKALYFESIVALEYKLYIPTVPYVYVVLIVDLG